MIHFYQHENDLLRAWSSKLERQGDRLAYSLAAIIVLIVVVAGYALWTSEAGRSECQSKLSTLAESQRVLHQSCTPH